MINNSPFPVWNEGLEEIKDGIFFKSTSCCFENKKACLEFYKGILGKKGFFQCPKGLSSYSTGEKHIFTSLRIEGFYDNSKISRIKGKPYLPTLPKSQFLSSVKMAERMLTEGDINQNNSTHQDRDVIDFSLHEIRRFNVQIKRFSEEILLHFEKNNGSDSNYVKPKVQSIFASSSLISTRLDIFDFDSNPESLTSHNPFFTEVFKKFDKAKRCLETFARDKKVKISLIGKSVYKMNLYPVFDFLPFVLIENAIKYSPDDQEVQVIFEDDVNFLEVRISSMGPLVEAKEKNRLFERKFRATNAEAFDKTGGGYGLFFSKLICEAHGLDISVNCGELKFNQNGIGFADFEVIIRYQK